LVGHWHLVIPKGNRGARHLSVGLAAQNKFEVSENRLSESSVEMARVTIAHFVYINCHTVDVSLRE
jgi:hypothetical protein